MIRFCSVALSQVDHAGISAWMRAITPDINSTTWLEVDNPDEAHVLIGGASWFDSEQRTELSRVINLGGKVEACWGEQPNVRGKFICLSLPINVGGFRRFLSLIEQRVHSLPEYRAEMTGR
jgi:hypothetical protein